MRRLVFLFFLLTVAAVSSQAAPFAVAGSSDPNALISSLFGTGITVVGTPTYTGATNQSGIFAGGLSSRVPFDSGVIMTSGDATRASVPFFFNDPGTALNTPGDSRLSALAGAPTSDAAVLTFSFTSTQSQFVVNFAFASSEYPIFPGLSYNDVFSLFLNGTNIALVPGTTLPVAVNNVNGLTNSAYYAGNTPLGYPDFEYGGITKQLTASGALQSGVNTVSIAIADATDDLLDSAVFIQGGTVTPSTPEPATFALLGAGLLGVVAALRKRRSQR